MNSTIDSWAEILVALVVGVIVAGLASWLWLGSFSPPVLVIFVSVTVLVMLWFALPRQPMKRRYQGSRARANLEDRGGRKVKKINKHHTALFGRLIVSTIVAVVVWVIACLFADWWTRPSTIAFVVAFLIAYILLTKLEAVIDREDQAARGELV